MTTTSSFQHKPDFFNSQEECLKNSKNEINTNPRYKHFTQNNFTAGDEEQFQAYRDEENGNVCTPDINLDNNIFVEQPFMQWHKYKNVEANAVINTFRYIFYKFKKGIFVKILNNKLVVFLPFSNSNFINEWSDRIHIDPKYGNLNDFLEHISNLQGYSFRPKQVNRNINEWFANNCLVRYELIRTPHNTLATNEGDSNVGTVKNMLEELCAQRNVPDIEFFINRRDFPILTTDGSEPYNHIWDSENFPLVSHEYPKYIPILSMVTSDKFADVPMPTYEDWARVQIPHSIWFPDSCKTNYNADFNKDWASKKPIAVFRGASTGCGVTIDTNTRLKLANLSHITPPDENGVPYLDAGITKWNLRPRKLQGQKYLQTIEISPRTPFSLAKHLTPQEQSNYKYIINVDGHVAAFRLSLELNMHSVILLVDSTWRIWYKNMLIPYTHYVPIKADLSNLLDQIKWCRNNDDKCQQIVANAQLFFQTYIQKNGILDYMQKTLVDIHKETGTYLYNINTPLQTQINMEYKSINYTYPPTSKSTTDIHIIPNFGRCFALLQGVQWIINMIISKPGHLEQYLSKAVQLGKNKLGIISRFNVARLPLVIKTTNDPQKIKEHIHEAYIGINSINELCKYIPNFTYTFALYEKTQTEGGITQTEGGGIPQTSSFSVINEYIKGPTLYEYIQSDQFNFEEYLFILIQISLAIEIAQQKCALVHWDLTPWNIILQFISVEQTFDYVISYNKIIRIKTRVIPIIIDFGKSHVIHNEHHHGFVNMFKTSTVQDILTLLITTIDQIAVTKQLNKQDFHHLLFLANFMSSSTYREQPFSKAQDLRAFMKKVRKFSTLIYSNKYELESLTPMDLVNYIYKMNYPKIKNSILFNITELKYSVMDKSNSRQVFDYILSKSTEEQLESFQNVFIRLKQCSLPLPDNLFFIYYVAQSLETNLVSVWNNMLFFLTKHNIPQDEYKKQFLNTMRFIKKIYQPKIDEMSKENVEYNQENNTGKYLLKSPYTEETFLSTNEVKQYLSSELDPTQQDISDYKEIIEMVLCNNTHYKLSETDKKYYIKNFEVLLNSNSIYMKNNIANPKTFNYLTNIIFSQNIDTLNNIPTNCYLKENYITTYTDIINLAN